MKLSELISVITNDVRIRIFRIDDMKTPLFVEYRGNFVVKDEAAEILKEDPKVVRLVARPEIRHRLYEERGLMPPFEPEITRQYEFSDLTIFLYYDVYVE